MKTIIAYDLGSNMAMASNASGPRRVESYKFSGTRRDVLPNILTWMTNQRELCKAHDACPDAVIYETPFARGQAATRMLWGIAGIIEAVWGGVSAVNSYTPSEIKKHCTGKGKADKDEMTFAAQLLGYGGDNEHEADAWCLLCYAEDTLTFEKDDQWVTASPTQKSSSSSASKRTSRQPKPPAEPKASPPAKSKRSSKSPPPAA